MCVPHDGAPGFEIDSARTKRHLLDREHVKLKIIDAFFGRRQDNGAQPLYDGMIDWVTVRRRRCCANL